MIFPPVVQRITRPIAATGQLMGSFPSVMSFPWLIAVTLKSGNRRSYASADVPNGGLQHEIGDGPKRALTIPSKIKLSNKYVNGHLGLHMHWAADVIGDSEADYVCTLIHKPESGDSHRQGEHRSKPGFKHLPVLINDVEPVQEPQGMPCRSLCRPVSSLVRLQTLKDCLNSLPSHMADVLRP